MNRKNNGAQDSCAGRELWADAMKGMLILMVVYYHIANGVVFDCRVLYAPYFMAAFFFIAGYFQKDSDSVSLLFYKKLKTLIRPVLVIGLFTSLLHLPTENVSVIDMGSIMARAYYRIIIGSGGLWFIYCLFVAHIVLALFLLLHNKFPVLSFFLSCLLSLLTMFFVDGRGNLPWNVQTALVMQFYMYAGYLSHKNNIISVVCKTTPVMLSALLYGVLAYCYADKIKCIDVHLNLYGAPFIYPLLVVTGIMILLYVSKMLCKIRFLVLAGKCSLLIYLLHGWVARIVQKLLNPVSSTFSCESYQIGISLFIFASTVFISIGIAILINTYWPWVVGRQKKSCYTSEAS